MVDHQQLNLVKNKMKDAQGKTSVFLLLKDKESIFGFRITPKNMPLINRFGDNPHTFVFTCVQPSRSMRELIRNNQREEESKETPIISPELEPDMEYRLASSIIKDRIRNSRKTRKHIKAYVITSESSQVVTGAVSHYFCMEPLLTLEFGGIGYENAPLYFEPIFKKSFEYLEQEQFDNFIRRLDLHLRDMISFVVTHIGIRIRELWPFLSPDFQNYSEEKEEKRRYAELTIEQLVSLRSRLNVCENRLKRNICLYIDSHIKLVRACTHSVPVSVVSAMSILKLRDALFYFYEDFEEGALDILDLIKDIYSV